MKDNIDDFPDLLLPSNGGKVKDFSFGGDEEEESDDGLEEGYRGTDEGEEEEEQQPEILPTPVADLDNLGGMMQRQEKDALDFLQAAADRALQDPAIAALAAVSSERFKTERPRADERSRVTRGWLQSLNQREFFIAIGYPGHVLHRLLDGGAALEEIREWVNGTKRIPTELRKILMLEHMLDRRTVANRAYMPSREKIEAALAKLLSVTRVSDVIGGFEGCGGLRGPAATEEQVEAAKEVADSLVIVRPDGSSPAARSRRPGSSLPPNQRVLGKGRALGERLSKPSTYCYTISKRSTDKSTGVPRLSPREVMDFVNRAADLEVRYGVYYSMRRRDSMLPWSRNNIELLPTEQLEAERTGKRG